MPHSNGHELTELLDLPYAQTPALVLGGASRDQLANKQARPVAEAVFGQFARSTFPNLGEHRNIDILTFDRIIHAQDCLHRSPACRRSGATAGNAARPDR